MKKNMMLIPVMMIGSLYGSEMSFISKYQCWDLSIVEEDIHKQQTADDNIILDIIQNQISAVITHTINIEQSYATAVTNMLNFIRAMKEDVDKSDNIALKKLYFAAAQVLLEDMVTIFAKKAQEMIQVKIEEALSEQEKSALRDKFNEQVSQITALLNKNILLFIGATDDQNQSYTPMTREKFNELMAKEREINVE